METIQLGATVDGQHIAFLKHVGGGDAMHDLVVDGQAQGAGEAVVALEVGRTAVFADVGLGGLVNFEQAHAGPRGPGCDPQGVGGQASGFAELVDFAAAFVSDLFADGHLHSSKKQSSA